MKRAGADDSLRCSFCHKRQDEVGKLVSSPSDNPRAYICDECIAVCNSIDDSLRCSFCHKGQDDVTTLISSPADYAPAHICNECIAACHSFLEDDKSAPDARVGHPVRLSDLDHPR